VADIEARRSNCDTYHCSFHYGSRIPSGRSLCRTRCISPRQRWIEFRFLEWSFPYSCRWSVPAEGTLFRPTGRLWPSGLISRPEYISAESPSGTYVFAEVVMFAGASLGTVGECGWHSGWGRLDVNREDPVELALAADLQKAAISHVAGPSCKTYKGQWNLSAAWCDAIKLPRATMQATDATVVLYLTSVVNRAKTFAPVKAAPAAIAFYPKINLFNHEPTQSPAVCIVWSAATRRLGHGNKNRKEFFEWEQVVTFAETCGVRQQSYCHLVAAAMFVNMFDAMCRCDDASDLMWRNIRFEADGSAFEISFNKRKNSQFRQGNKVLAAAFPFARMCPVRLL